MADDVWTIEKPSGLFNPEHGEAERRASTIVCLWKGLFPYDG